MNYNKLPQKGVKNPIRVDKQVPTQWESEVRPVMPSDEDMIATGYSTKIGGPKGVEKIGLNVTKNTVGEGSEVFSVTLDASTATTDSFVAIGGWAGFTQKMGSGVFPAPVSEIGEIDPALTDDLGVNLAKLVRFGAQTMIGGVIAHKININSLNAVQVAQDMTLRSYTFDGEYKDQKLNLPSGVSMYSDNDNIREVVNNDGAWFIGGNQTLRYRVKAGAVVTINIYVSAESSSTVVTKTQ